MGTIGVHEFITLDGVIDSPTWTFDYPFDPKMGEAIAAIMRASNAILLGASPMNNSPRPGHADHVRRRASRAARLSRTSVLRAVQTQLPHRAGVLRCCDLRRAVWCWTRSIGLARRIALRSPGPFWPRATTTACSAVGALTRTGTSRCVVSRLTVAGGEFVFLSAKELNEDDGT